MIQVQELLSEPRIKNLGQGVRTGQGNNGQWNLIVQYQFSVYGVWVLYAYHPVLPASCLELSLESKTKCKCRKESYQQEASDAT